MKQIIILGSSIQGDVSFLNCAFWFPITSGMLPRTTGSVWTGATAEEDAAIQDGTVLEELTTHQAPRGVDPTVIEALLLQLWTNRNAALGGRGPASFAGVFNDSGYGWSPLPTGSKL